MRPGVVGGGAVLTGAALLCLAGCSTGTPRGGGTPIATDAATSPVATSAERARPARSVLTPEAPVAATLPSGEVVPIRAATTRNGLLEVPADIGIAAWWKGGSRLGDPFGSTLVAAHVDSTTQGLGPFAELLTVDRGERIVLDSAHLTQEYEVASLRLVPQGSLDDEQWLFEPTGTHRLTLVTCAPPYDRSRGGYQNLAVVTATPVSAPTRDRSR